MLIEEGVPSLRGKKEVHVDSLCSGPEWVSGLNVLSLTFSGGGSVRPEDLSVNVGKFRPLVVESVGIEWVVGGSGVSSGGNIGVAIKDMIGGPPTKGSGSLSNQCPSWTVVMSSDSSELVSVSSAGQESGAWVGCH